MRIMMLTHLSVWSSWSLNVFCTYHFCKAWTVLWSKWLVNDKGILCWGSMNKNLTWKLGETSTGDGSTLQAPKVIFQIHWWYYLFLPMLLEKQILNQLSSVGKSTCMPLPMKFLLHNHHKGCGMEFCFHDWCIEDDFASVVFFWVSAILV